MPQRAIPAHWPEGGATLLPGSEECQAGDSGGCVDALEKRVLPFGRFCGAIAQLGERLNGIQEVDGSIPSGSTRNGRRLAAVFPFREGELTGFT